MPLSYVAKLASVNAALALLRLAWRVAGPILRRKIREALIEILASSASESLLRRAGSPSVPADKPNPDESKTWP